MGLKTESAEHATPLGSLKQRLQVGDESFWPELAAASRNAIDFGDLIALSTLRRRALQRGMAVPERPKPVPLRLAILGAYSSYPLHDLITHLLATTGAPSPFQLELFLGEYDNYMAEALEEASALYAFKPEMVLLLPSARRCRYEGDLFDPSDKQESQARQTAEQTLQVCRLIHERTKSEVILANFALPARFDPGPYRTRTLGSDWSFRKTANLAMGLNAPSYVHICDVEFLSARRGTLASTDERAWFESKQIGSPDLLLDIAREVTQIINSFRQGPKKVLVLDLDNTLWGGVVGDDGLDGIEIGDTSPRAEAFKSFQQHLLALSRRGVLLAVCSKNDEEKALEPFLSHPEMVLRREHFVSFKANWRPKSDNIREIAQELNLGLDSFVFVDDNPAEVDIVRQFAPEVTCILLGSDPSLYSAQIQDSRLFEAFSITAEDVQRVEQYRQEGQRQALQTNFTDMAAYLESLEMKGRIDEFRSVDVPRIAQLINRSNQFNVTTRRRTEAEVQLLLTDPTCCGFTIRLEDRFGDYGLIAVVIGRVDGETMQIDTWLMSCRVLKRQVEEETVNEMVRLARTRACRTIKGVYIPTKKNGMVRDLYDNMGFAVTYDGDDRREFELDLLGYAQKETKIQVLHRAI
jgi:FkbH-like protein